MSIPVKHVVPSQRRHYRVTVPITIAIDGREYATLDWSISGFRIHTAQAFDPGSQRHAYVKIPFHGFDVGFMTRIRVLRYDRLAQDMAAEFLEIDERGEKTLSAFIQGIISGEMEEVDGVIRRLDLPVTPATLMPPDHQHYVSEELLEQKRQRGLRIYKAAGKVLAAVLLVVLYTNIFEMRVDSALVTGRNDVLLSPASGDIVYMAPEQTPVHTGQTLVTLTDQGLEDSIAAAQAKLREASVEAKRLNAMSALEKKRLDAAHRIASEEWSAASDSVEALKKNLAVKRDTLERYRGLFQEGYASKVMVDKAEGDYLDVERQLHEARQEASRRRETYHTIQTGFQVNDSMVESGVQDSETLTEAAQERLDNAKQELDAMRGRKARLTLAAPADGQLVRVFTPQASSAKYGDPIAVFERSGTRVVQAFLTQKEALHVAKGQQASVYFPGRWWSVPATVTDVDYYSLTLNQTRGSLQWQNGDSDQFKTVVVTLEPADGQAAKDMHAISAGTASTVVFNLL